MSEDLVGTLLSKIKALESDLTTLRDTVAAQREQIEDLETEVSELRAENRQLEDRVVEAEQTVDRYADRLTNHDQTLTELDAHTDALGKKTALNESRLAELQARELEKGAHLNAEHVLPEELPLEADHLERITKDGGQYYRLPDSEDPLNRGGEVQLAHGDLLPIQQLAQMDEDMLNSATSSLPAKLAAKLWQAWVDPDVGDNPWQQGNQNVRVSVSASDLRHWIRRQEHGISKEYAQKLVGRTIDAILELSQHRLAVHKHQQRKNGLQYTERRLLVPRDSAIPGHGSTDAPGTAGVHG